MNINIQNKAVLYMKKSVAAHCPYCGNMINYFYLYDAKRSDFGYCSHCGGMYAVKYSPLAYMLVMGAMGALLGGFAFWYLANKTLPGAKYLMICTAVIVGLYFLTPLMITPRRVIVRGRLGGFPSPEYIPVHRRDRKRANRKLVEKHRPEVLQPQEKDTESKLTKNNTNGTEQEKSERQQSQRTPRHMYQETEQRNGIKANRQHLKNTKRKNKHENTDSIASAALQKIRMWGSRGKSAVAALGDCIKTAAGRTGEQIGRWWKRCFRKREKPGKGQ